MATRIRIFDRFGSPLAEIDAVCPRSWVLNGIGQAQLTIAKTDPKATERNLRFGNLVYIEHDRAPAWGGVLWPSAPRTWTDTAIHFAAIGPESILKRRRTNFQGEQATLQGLLGVANQAEDTRLRFAEGSANPGLILEGNWYWPSVHALITVLATNTGYEWGAEPRLDWTGRLLFDVAFYRRRGVERSQTLIEGVNVAKASGESPVVTEQGDIFNDVLAWGDATNTDRTAMINSNQASINLYGLSQETIPAGTTDALTANEMSKTELAARQFPRRTFKLSALDVNNTFDSLRLGDTLPVWLTRYGFTDNQPEGSTIARTILSPQPGGDTAAIGNQTRRLPAFQAGRSGLFTYARVMGMGYDETDGQMPLVLDEVEV